MKRASILKESTYSAIQMKDNIFMPLGKKLNMLEKVLL